MPWEARRGKDIAERWCVSCHIVDHGQEHAPTDQAPPFASVARMPSFDADRLAMLMLKPHPNMPMLVLTRDEVADLAACILTFGQ